MFLSDDDLDRIAKNVSREVNTDLRETIREIVQQETSNWNHVAPLEHYEDHQFIGFLRGLFRKASNGLFNAMIFVVILSIIGLAAVGIGSELGMKAIKLFK